MELWRGYFGEESKAILAKGNPLGRFLALTIARKVALYEEGSDYSFNDLLFSGGGLCQTAKTYALSYAGKYFPNLNKSNRNQIVFTMQQLIWNQTDTVHLVPNQSVHGKYNLIWVLFNNIPKIFVYSKNSAT